MSEDSYKAFWKHAEELANRLKVVLYTLIVSTILMTILPVNPAVLINRFAFYEPLVAVILRAVRKQVLPEGVKLIGLELVNPVELYLLTSFFFGLTITMPVLAYELFKFVNPALYPHERRDVYPVLASFLFLFVAGLVFGYLILVPYGLAALLPFFQMVGAEPYISVNSFYYFVFFLTLMSGLTFTFPIVLVLLVKYGITETGNVTKNRKYIYFVLLVVVFAITPGEGGLANLMLLATTITLFEAGIFLAKRYEKRGEIRRARWFMGKDKCKFCGEDIDSHVTFCPKCGKSQK